MNRTSLFVSLGSLAVLVLLAIVVLGRGGVSGTGSNRDTELVAALERINDNQAKLAERLDRLESRNGVSNVASAARPPNMPGGRPGGVGSNSSSIAIPIQEQEALTAKQRLDMENRLISDPLSPKWAQANETTIANFLAPANLAKQQLPVPKDYKAQCHSHLCRISMSFPDELQATQTQSQLLMEIASTMPAAKIFMLPRPDGSVELLIFAGDPPSVH